MQIKIADLQSAVSQVLSPRLAALVPAAMASLHPDRAEIEQTDLGLLLATCLFGGNAGDDREIADALVLSKVEVQGPSGYVALDASAALAHPLLMDWVGYCFGDALAAPVLAGLLLNDLAPGAPIYRRVELIEVEGRGVCGTASLWFDNVQTEAFLHYGDTANPTSLTTLRRCPGASLRAIGDALREAPTLTAAAAFGSIVAAAISDEAADAPAAQHTPFNFWPETMH